MPLIASITGLGNLELQLCLAMNQNYDFDWEARMLGELYHFLADKKS